MRWIALGAVMAWSGRAIADDEIVKGAVLKVEHQEIYVNLGTGRGVVDSAPLRIKRPIKLRHPVTSAAIEDWIPIGSATVTQAGATLSRAVVGELITAIKVGDLVEVLIDRPDQPRVVPTVPTGPTVATQPAVTKATHDPGVLEVLRLFAAQTGLPIDARIAGWEQYLSTHATSPYAAAIRRDIDGLVALRDQLVLQPRGTDVVTTVKHTAAKTATRGGAMPVVFVLDQPDRVASAFLHYRSRGATTYRRLLLTREHDIYLRGAVPADVVVPPGLQYFVEVSLPSGQAGLALGSPGQPVEVDVAPASLIDRFGSAPGQSSVKLTTEVLDFATFDSRAGDRRDSMVAANIDFTYKLASIVNSIGVGYGVFAGQGGYKDRVWSSPDLGDGNAIPKSGFQFGYADIELGGKAEGIHLAGGGKLIAGVGKEGFGLGIEGRFRIGERESANLVFAARTIDQVGFVSDIKFASRPIGDVLLGVSVGATNQPNEGDIAAKLGVEVEYIGFEHVSFILRSSWQGRSTAHGGLGGGAGLGFYW